MIVVGDPVSPFMLGGDIYHHLLSFREVVPGVAVQGHLAQLRDWNIFLGDNLGGVEQIKSEAELVLLVHDLNTELEKLRRQVHDLKQESADKEVKIVQLTKSRNQDKEDMQGLNIALDSKQQELELVSISFSLLTASSSARCCVVSSNRLPAVDEIEVERRASGG